MYTLFDRIFVGLARTIYIRFTYGIFGRESPNIRSYTVHIYGSGQPYIFGDFPARNTVYASYIYGPGQP
jgi:hypothetical protein